MLYIILQTQQLIKPLLQFCVINKTFCITEGTFALRGSKMSLDEVGQEGSQHHLVSRTSMLSSSMLNINPRQQLLQARDILELGLKNVSYARQAVALSDGKSIADISWAKVGAALTCRHILFLPDVKTSISGT